MKPEYRFSSEPEYYVKLLSDTDLKNRTAVLKIIRNTVPSYNELSLYDLQKLYREKSVVMYWRFFEERKPEMDILVNQLENAHATFSVETINIPIIFPTDALYTRYYKQSEYINQNLHPLLQKPISAEQHHESAFNLAKKSVRSDSQYITALHEYSLSHWAETEQITEAYRFIAMPSFEQYLSLRIWSTPTTIETVFSEGLGESYSPVPVKTQHWKLSKDKWQSIRDFMQTYFWPAESWYSVPLGYSVLDGTRYIFEGWHNLTYKFFDDHSPDKDKISWQAIELFYDLIKKHNIETD